MKAVFSDMPFVLPLAALVLVLSLVPLLRRAAPYLGLMDKPDERKTHEGVVPLIGGLVVLPVYIGLSILGGASFTQNWPLYSGILILLLTGAVDDRLHLPAFLKFGLQFIAAGLAVMVGGAILTDLGPLFGLGVFSLGWIALPFSVVAVVLLVNAINLMDGLDGLAGGTVLIILGWFACALWMGDVRSGELSEVLILMAALAGFLFYNMRSPWRKKASIFMGDAGSLSLGLVVGWYAIRLSPEVAAGPRVLEPMAAAWILAVPIWDECAQFYRRVKEGRHPFSPDRGHFHHHFERAGITPGCASLCVHAVVFFTGAIGVLGVMVGVPLPVLTVLWIGGILAHMAYSRSLENYTRLFTRLRGLMTSSKACSPPRI